MLQSITEVRELVKGKRACILGVSGAGKSWTLAQLGGKDLDSIGYEQENKWLIDLAKLSKVKTDVVGFTGDNQKAVLAAFKPEIAVIVTTAPFILRRALELKVRDYDGTNVSFVQYWAQKAFMSDSQLKKYLTKKNAELRRLVGRRCPVYEFRNLHTAKVSAGWDQSSSINI